MLLRYVGPPDLYYPTIPVEPEPERVYDLAADPGDGHWEFAGPPIETGGNNPPTETGGGEPSVETSLSVNVHNDEEA